MEYKKRILIGLVGESGSGKDTVAEYLTRHYGAKVMRFIDPLKDALHIYFDQISKEDQQWLAIEFKKRFGANILCKGLKRRIDKEEGLVVVNGIRYWEDYEMVKNFPESHVIYTTADRKLRWERSIKRGEKSDDNMSFEKFQEIERGATEVLIPEIGATADFKIVNEKDLDYLYTSVDEIMKKVLNK